MHGSLILAFASLLPLPIRYPKRKALHEPFSGRVIRLKLSANRVSGS